MGEPEAPPTPDESAATIPMQATSRPVSQTSQPSASHYVPELPLAEELQVLLEGKYIVEGFLGQGGMGAVYRGLQMPLRRPVAIKILAKRGSETEDEFDFEERFKREAYAMAALAHPNIVQVYDCGDAGEHYLYISMELVEGGDLSDAIKRGDLTPERALKMIPQICDGLQAAHERGIVHRDIKPANIFLTADGRPKVADFGLAKKFDAQSTFATKTGMSMGTPDYAAPEQFDAVKDLDHRADVYSLGVMMYQMLTGNLPRGNYRPASQRVGTDPRIDEVLGKAMEHDRNDRYQSVAEIKADVLAIATLGTGPVPTKPMPTAAVLDPTVARMAPAGSRPAAQPVTMPAIPAPPKKKSGAAGMIAMGGALTVLAVAAWFTLRPKPPVPLPNAAGAGAPSRATKDAPFINTLGMKFVPVPGTNILLCIHETRKGDYAKYAAENPVKDAWKNPIERGSPVSEGDDHPVVNVSWDEARAFCSWLGKKERLIYRLPTDREWSEAVGIGPDEDAGWTPEELNGKLINRYPWGTASAWPPKNFGNYADTTAKEKMPGIAAMGGYTDGYPTTAPVMSFEPDRLGLYDLSGNVWEWCEGWYSAANKEKVRRGGAWDHSFSGYLNSSGRGKGAPGAVHPTVGFRCALVISRELSAPSHERE